MRRILQCHVMTYYRFDPHLLWSTYRSLLGHRNKSCSLCVLYESIYQNVNNCVTMIHLWLLWFLFVRSWHQVIQQKKQTKKNNRQIKQLGTETEIEKVKLTSELCSSIFGLLPYVISILAWRLTAVLSNTPPPYSPCSHHPFPLIISLQIPVSSSSITTALRDNVITFTVIGNIKVSTIRIKNSWPTL